MSGGLNLSFSVQSAGLKTGVCLVVLAVFGFLAPVAYFAWWGLAGGGRVEARCRVRSALKLDPAKEAAGAVGRGDYRLYLTNGCQVPGCGSIRRDYGKRFGYRQLPVLCGEDLTAEDEKLNGDATEYAKTYNQIVRQNVEKSFPNWWTEVDPEEIGY